MPRLCSIVGGDDDVVLKLNREAIAQLPKQTKSKLEVIPGATHLFEEPGALDQVAMLARAWTREHLSLRLQKQQLSARPYYERISNGSGTVRPDSVGMLGSVRATNEDNCIAQKFARVVLGTNNVDYCACVRHAPSAAGMKQMLGAGAVRNSFEDIEKVRTVLICGANPTENHHLRVSIGT